MIPVGYMFKRVVARPDWIESPNVANIYSVSNCVSEYFADYIKYWKHNGYWLFDNPTIMMAIIKEIGIDLADLTLFYYEVFETEFDAESRDWRNFQPEASFPTQVEIPTTPRLEGYDVITFSVGTSPECSPLSCNNLASKIATNQHCLFDSFERAKYALEAGEFDDSEPGPFRIFAVYTVHL